MAENEGVAEAEKVLLDEGLPAVINYENKPVSVRLCWNYETLYLEYDDGKKKNKVDLSLYLYHDLIDRFGLEIYIISENQFLPTKQAFSFSNTENREKLDLVLRRNNELIKNSQLFYKQRLYNDLRQNGYLSEKEVKSYFNRVGLKVEVNEYFKDNDMKSICFEEWLKVCNHMATLETSDSLTKIFDRFSTLFEEGQLMTQDNLADFLNSYNGERAECTQEKLQQVMQKHVKEVRMTI